MIKFFQDISNSDVKEVGGKAASLGELTRADFPVPPGFVIPTEAYRKFYNQPFPIEIKNEILQAFDKLGAERVAVRSSAVAEDSPSSSWAGQLDSYLSVSKDELLDSVRKCWSSINSGRALFYAAQQNISQQQMNIAVIVQKMVESDASGVIFTVNPISKDYKELLVESGFGLGEMLVQGLISPDSFVIDKDSLKIKSKDINYQEKKLISAVGKNKEISLQKSQGETQSISDTQLRTLAKLSVEIEKHYGKPQDIEWAIAKGSIYIVQARPITTLSKQIEAEKVKVSAKKEFLSGLPASHGIKSGKVRIIKNLDQLPQVKNGEILVAVKTTPDFVEAFGKIGALITDQGGSTAHAAIVARELGIPAVVGTKNSTQVLKTGQLVTVDGNQGRVYMGKVELKITATEDSRIKKLDYTENDTEDIVNAITMSINDATELWPLKPGQLMPYFDTDQAIDFYEKLKQLVNSGVSFAKIANLIKHPTSLRLFLLNSGIVGFKAGRVLKIAPVNIDDQMIFMDWVVKLLKRFTPDDPFCLKGTNYVWGNKKVAEFIDESKWIQINSSFKKAVGLLNVNIISYIWAFFWDYFPDASSETYGPYLLNKAIFNKDKKLLIKDHFNLAPIEIWPLANKLPFKSLILAQTYDKDDIFLNFGNRIANKESLTDHNNYFSIKVDNRYIVKEKEILELTKILASLAKQQVQVVNGLSDMDKVRKGSLLAYYAMKDFYLHFDKDWYPKKRVEGTIKALGDQFLTQNKIQKDLSIEEKRKFFDPRNDYF